MILGYDDGEIRIPLPWTPHAADDVRPPAPSLAASASALSHSIFPLQDVSYAGLPGVRHPSGRSWVPSSSTFRSQSVPPPLTGARKLLGPDDPIEVSAVEALSSLASSGSRPVDAGRPSNHSLSQFHHPPRLPSMTANLPSDPLLLPLLGPTLPALRFPHAQRPPNVPFPVEPERRVSYSLPSASTLTEYAGQHLPYLSAPRESSGHSAGPPVFRHPFPVDVGLPQAQIQPRPPQQPPLPYQFARATSDSVIRPYSFPSPLEPPSLSPTITAPSRQLSGEPQPSTTRPSVPKRTSNKKILNSTEANAKRRRTLIACERCRQHKLRCLGGSPCPACSKRGVGEECTYVAEVRRRGKAKKKRAGAAGQEGEADGDGDGDDMERGWSAGSGGERDAETPSIQGQATSLDFHPAAQPEKPIPDVHVVDFANLNSRTISDSLFGQTRDARFPSDGSSSVASSARTSVSTSSASGGSAARSTVHGLLGQDDHKYLADRLRRSHVDS